MITPGPLTAKAAAELNQALQSLRALIEGLSTCVSEPLGVQRTGPRFQLRLGLDLPFPAKITGGTNPYSWKEVMPGAAGAFVDVPGGGTGTTNAYESGGSATVATGTVVEMHRGYPASNGQKYWFERAPAGAGGGLTVREADGAPTVAATVLEVPNSSLTVVGTTAQLAEASLTRAGVVNLFIGSQQMGRGNKGFDSISLSEAGQSPKEGDPYLLRGTPNLPEANVLFVGAFGTFSSGAHLRIGGGGELQFGGPSVKQIGSDGTTPYWQTHCIAGSFSVVLELSFSNAYLFLRGGNQFGAKAVYAIADDVGNPLYGATATFTTADGKTVTVRGGIIVNVA